MKADIYYLYENGEKKNYSKSFEKILNKTTNTTNGVIYYNNCIVWVQKPELNGGASVYSAFEESKEETKEETKEEAGTPTQAQIRLAQCQVRIEKLHKKIERLKGLIEKKQARIDNGKEEANKWPNGGYIISCDIEWHKDDIASAERELSREYKKLEEYKAKREAEIKKAQEMPRIEAVEMFLKEWRNKAYEFYTKELEEVGPFIRDVESQGLKYKEQQEILRKRFTELVLGLHHTSNKLEKLNKILDREVRDKREQLFERCFYVVGKITDASMLYIGHDGSLNGHIAGEKGKASVTTIYAGGYNIQCLHYRVLVHKIK